MNIGQAAAGSGCHRETIRYYERIGLLPEPVRRGSGYRDYDAGDVERLRFISRGRELGFSLDEIRSLLRLAGDPGLDCAEVDQLARVHLAEIQARRRELARMAKALEATIAACSGHGSRAACAILGSLRSPAAAPAATTTPVSAPRKPGSAPPQAAARARPAPGSTAACSGLGDIHAAPANVRRARAPG